MRNNSFNYVFYFLLFPVVEATSLLEGQYETISNVEGVLGLGRDFAEMKTSSATAVVDLYNNVSSIESQLIIMIY